MVFARQYSKRSLTVATPAVKREVPASVKCAVQGKDILALHGPLVQHVVPCLSTPDLLHLATTCKELRKRLAGLVLYLRCGIDFHPRALGKVLTLLPGFPCLRVLELGGCVLCPEHVVAIAQLLRPSLDPSPSPSASPSQPSCLLAPSLRVLSLRRRRPVLADVTGGRQLKPHSQAIQQLLRGLCVVGGWFRGLQHLDLTGHHLSDTPLQHLLAWLQAGRGRRLRRLSLSATSLHPSELLVLMGVLGEGSCPHLLRLDLVHVCCSPALAPTQYAQLMHSAAQTPPCVAVPLVWGLEEKVQVWTKALQAMPALRELELDGSGVEGEVSLALSAAWKGTSTATATATAKAARRIRRIDMAHCNITEQGVSSLLRGLGAGRCPCLLALGLKDTGLEHDGFVELGRALRGGQLGQLRRLDVAHNNLTYEGLREVVDALCEGVCPKLEVLELEAAPTPLGDPGLVEEVNEMACAWLAKLKADGHCPRLRLHTHKHSNSNTSSKHTSQ